MVTKIRTKENINKKLCNIIAFVLCFPLINYSVPYFGKLLLGESSKLFAYFLFIIYIFSICYAFYLTNFKVSPTKIYIIISLYIFLIISMIIHPEIKKYIWTSVDDPLNPTYSFFIYSILVFLLTDTLHDYRTLVKNIIPYACIGIALCFIYFIFALNNDIDLGYMTLSYNLLFPTIIVVLYSLLNFHILPFSFGLLGFLMIFFAGSRGALVSFVVPFILFLFLQRNLSKYIRFTILLFLFISVFIVLTSWNSLYETISGILKDIGFNSRTFEKISNLNFFEDSSRKDIFINTIQNSSIFPKGLFYDRLINGTHSYAHNIFAEFIVDYGFIIGTILFLSMFFLIINSINKGTDYYRFLIIALISGGVIKLLFSSSYLSGEPYFYFMIGISMNIIKQKKYISSHSDNPRR